MIEKCNLVYNVFSLGNIGKISELFFSKTWLLGDVLIQIILHENNINAFVSAKIPNSYKKKLPKIITNNETAIYIRLAQPSAIVYTEWNASQK